MVANFYGEITFKPSDPLISFKSIVIANIVKNTYLCAKQT